MRELQSSLKNPVGNLGLLITEGVKRSKRYDMYSRAYNCMCYVKLNKSRVTLFPLQNGGS